MVEDAAGAAGRCVPVDLAEVEGGRAERPGAERTAGDAAGGAHHRALGGVAGDNAVIKGERAFKVEDAAAESAGKAPGDGQSLQRQVP